MKRQFEVLLSTTPDDADSAMLYVDTFPTGKHIVTMVSKLQGEKRTNTVAIAVDEEQLRCMYTMLGRLLKHMT